MVLATCVLVERFRQTPEPSRCPTVPVAPNSQLQSRNFMKPPIIAIDGPSGAGKGTIARAVAARLGYRHVDTGAMYRALAWKALEERTDPSDEPAVAALAVRVRFEVGDGRIRIDERDV